MAYRGDDLDLRTPQGWSNAGRDSGSEPNWWTRTAVYKGGTSDPLWVDDHVMACCNHAFDLAVAHRAPEVRLEHLINALTLSDAATQVLEARGLGVSSLRRESGASIANDIPAVSGNGQLVPKRSEALVEALRQAADYAYPRRTPVTVDDLLHVLFGMKRDLPGVQLLHRHATSWSGRNGADVRLDPLPRLAAYSPPPPRPRYVSSQAHDYFSQPAREPITREPPLREPLSRDYTPHTNTDSFQDTRLDSLERAVRDLGVDLTEDRKTIRSLVADLHRTTTAQADDTGRFRGGLSDRLASLEDAMLRARGDSGQIPSALMDRFAGIERTLDARLADLSRSQASGVPSALIDRLASLERALEARLIEVSRASAAVVDRLSMLESTQQRPVEATLSPLVNQRLDSLTGFASKLDSVERTFQLILDRMTGIERKLSTASGDSDLSPVTDLLSGIETRVVGLERSIENRSAETGRTVSFIGERLRSFEEAISGQKSLTTEQLGQLERALTAYAESTVTAGSTRGEELTELHEALLKLNANQQTLATSLDSWRLDNTGDLSVINNRLKVIEETEHQQNPLVGNLAEQIAAIHRTIARREARKSRFRNWLFGTDEWYSSSYDTQRWRTRQTEPVVPRTLTETVSIQQRPTPPSPPPSMLRR